MSDAFDAALAIVFANEGGYVDDAHDDGQETKYGISKARYPDLDVRNLTIDGARDLYRRDYWDRFRCGEMPWPLCAVVMDCVVNHSPLNPIRWLQESVGAYADGGLGPRTLAAVKRCADPIGAAGSITSQRIEYVKRLPDYPRFGKGWHRRHVRTLTEALRRCGEFNE